MAAVSVDPAHFLPIRTSIPDRSRVFHVWTNARRALQSDIQRSMVAFASWGVFEDRVTGHTLRVVNLHTDYASRDNRLKSMALVAERIGDWADERLLVVGDFNALSGWQELTGLPDIEFPKVPGSTYHFNRGWHLFPAIDHLGHRGLKVSAGPFVDQRQFQQRYGSDHYLVWADYQFDR